jgi:hypothetical protein
VVVILKTTVIAFIFETVTIEIPRDDGDGGDLEDSGETNILRTRVIVLIFETTTCEIPQDDDGGCHLEDDGDCIHLRDGDY